MTQSQTLELLERATAELRPSADLVAAGIATGRRRRRRGLAVVATGTIAGAAVAAVAGAVVLVPGGGSAGDRTLVADRSAPPSGSHGSAPSTPVVPDPAPDVVAPYDGPFPLPPEAMASTLAALLHGDVTHPQNSDQHPARPDGSQSGAVDLDGASVSVAFQHSTGPRCDGDLGLSSCTALGDGFLGTYSATVEHWPTGPTGARGVGVTFYTSDGFKISVTATNAGSADPETPVRDKPVLDVAQLTAIAQDPVWR